MPDIFSRNYQSRLYQRQQQQLQLQSQGSSASEPDPQQTKISATTTLESKKNSGINFDFLEFETICTTSELYEN